MLANDFERPDADRARDECDRPREGEGEREGLRARAHELEHGPQAPPLEHSSSPRSEDPHELTEAPDLVAVEFARERDDRQDPGERRDDEADPEPTALRQD